MRAAGALLGLASALWAAKAFPPPPPNYLHNEGVVSGAAAERISLRLRAVEEKTKRQFVAALFQSLEGESLEDYANRLFKSWGVGDKKKNDGLLFCLFLQERRWRVEVGYGLEGTLTDLEAAEIARERGVPHFKAGDFDKGVEAAIEGLASKLEGTYSAPGPAPAEGPGQDAPLIIFLLVAACVVAGAVLRSLGRTTSIGRRRGGGGWSYGGDWSSSSGGYDSGGGSGGFSGGGGSSGGGGASGGW